MERKVLVLGAGKIVGAIVDLLPELRLGVHVGIGLDDQIGAPRFRGLLEVAWTPRVERPPPAAQPPPTQPDDDNSDEP